MNKFVWTGLVLVALWAVAADAQTVCKDDEDCKGICIEDKDCRGSFTNTRICTPSEEKRECDQCCDEKCEEPITYNKCVGPHCQPQCFKPKSVLLETALTCYKAGDLLVCVFCECPECWDGKVPEDLVEKARRKILNLDCGVEDVKFVFKCGNKNEEFYPCSYYYGGNYLCLEKWFDLRVKLYTTYTCKHREDIGCKRTKSVYKEDNCRRCDQENNKSEYSDVSSTKTTYMCMTGDRARCRPQKSFRIAFPVQRCRSCTLGPFGSDNRCEYCYGPNGRYETKPPRCVVKGLSKEQCRILAP
ncbi:hypothetical protein NDN08_007011 [Rhodosorus marinus]|uniref:TNFR-Cys domain-containing protein n=1 Tax=Rhodosorus marinus TaxID=101924 RepID=A0AAV8UFA3_9RHOD|nr:hypothetical protein NDN08_007011 [Rhodosorus marinus]